MFGSTAASFSFFFIDFPNQLLVEKPRVRGFSMSLEYKCTTTVVRRVVKDGVIN